MTRALSHKTEKLPDTGSFDLFRITHSKKAVDISTSTIRKYIREGLNSYKCRKSCYVSRTELAQFIRTRPVSKAEIAAAETASQKASAAAVRSHQARRNNLQSAVAA